MVYKRVVVGDCEADQLYVYKTGEKPTKIHCGVFVDINSEKKAIFVDKTWVSRIEGSQPLEDMPAYLSSCDLIYMHNMIGYDRKLIKDVLGYEIPIEKCRDSLVLSMFANNTKYHAGHPRRRHKHSVEAWANWLNLPQKKIQHDDWSTFSLEMFNRCQADVFIQSVIVKTILNELGDTPEYAIDLEMRFAEYLERMRANGFYCDTKQAYAFLDEFSKDAAELEEEIKRVFPPKRQLVKHFVPRFKKDGTPYENDVKFAAAYGIPLVEQDVYVDVPFNIGSPLQRIERLLEVGWVPLETTAKGNPKSPKADCPSLQADNLPEEVKLFGKYLISMSRIATINQWLAEQDKSGYVHGTITPIGTWTYRSAHREPNMGNIPARGEGSRVRSCFGVEDKKNRVLVGADASGIQSRAMAHYIAQYTGDDTYVKVVSDPSVDIHEYNREVAGIKTRSEAKTFYYQFLLGGGYFKTGKIFKLDKDEYPELLEFMRVNSLKKTLEASMSFTNTPLNDENFAIATRGWQVKTSFIEKVPGLKEFRDTAIEQMGAAGFVTLLDGRRTAVESSYNVMAALLQGFETIIMRRTLVATAWELDKKKIPWWSRNYIHDESQIETEKEYAEIVGQTFKKHLIESGKKFNSLCPLDAEYITHVMEEVVVDGSKVKRRITPETFTTTWAQTH